jgi:cellulose synthase/poly-beta-1,6-N-acetylglucosamine synthase-like glycosyltransferase
MTILFYIIVVVYMLALSYITIFCLMQFHLLFLYKKHWASRKNTGSASEDNLEWPVVTIQLPIYNEMYVVERLVDNIAQIDYPREKLEIQVLDDSTDQTRHITKRKVQEYKQKGFDIRLITRPTRSGYKAGALEEGLKYARGKFIAIFDADFLPRPEFLKETIPHFRNPEVGVVQTRWEHLNQDYSLITRLQAFQLNVHFTVEQTGRQAGKLMLQFNGTAGIWRREAILESGGWEADTLTEDLDLSYRAQLQGWRVLFLEELGSPAELPAEMNGLKSQQYRWMKGGAQTARKILPTLWRSDLSLTQKIHATLHLMASAIFVFVFIVGVFSVPVLFLLDPLGLNSNYFAFFLTGLLSIVAVYYVANVQANLDDATTSRKILKFSILFPLFLALSMGLSLHNSIAVLQGWIGRKSPFIRTPKFNIQSLTDSFKENHYLARKIGFSTVFEGMLALYFLAAFIAGLITGDTTFLIFHLILAFGFGTIFYFSIRHLSFK